MKRIITAIYILLSLNVDVCSGQTHTVGVFINDTTRTFKGYTLFAPKQDTVTFLINNDGRKVHEWKASHYPPGQSVYLLDNGNILRTCMTPGSLGTGGGEGGRIEEYNWNDSLVWYLDYSTSTYMQHHDIKRLPNGNIIMLVVEKRTMAEIIAAGFDTSDFQPDIATKGFMLPDGVVEIHPTYPSGGTVVWQWHVWDHLIQHFDATKSNYGIVSAHPELINDSGDHLKLPLFWNHMNSIDYNSDFDQIALSVRGNSEVWVIDHSTTTAQAAGHTGGIRGKGGDLLYRWGNPITYDRGTGSTQKYDQQHDVEWIRTGCPGAGNLLCFNNGVSRNYSTIDEITPPVDTNGNYTLPTGSSAFGPSGFTWSYQASPPTSMFGHDISGAQRLPNGNTLIDVGPIGTFYEVTASGTVVWKYINPCTNNGPLTQGDTLPNNPVRTDEKMNSVFRVYRYAPNYPAFNGKTLTPGNFVEIYPAAENEVFQQNTIRNYPNPFTGKIYVDNVSSDAHFLLLNITGQLLWSGDQIEQYDFSSINAGLYLLKIVTQNSNQTIKIMKQ